MLMHRFRSVIHLFGLLSLGCTFAACTATTAASPRLDPLPSTAPPYSLPLIAAGAWVTQDTWRGLLHIHQLPPARTVSLRAPDWLAVDLNTTAQIMCGRASASLLRLHLPTQTLTQVDFPWEPGSTSPGVAASRTGTCVSAGSDEQAFWVDKDSTLRTVTLRLPNGMARFDWQDLVYDGDQDIFIATGRQGFALIPASRFADTVEVIEFKGKLNDRLLGVVRATSLRWCSAFFRENKGLVCKATLGDESLSALTALVMIDAKKGQLRRVLLPRSASSHDDAVSVGVGEASVPSARLWRTGSSFKVLGHAPAAENLQAPALLTFHARTGELSIAHVQRPAVADLVGLGQPIGTAIWLTDEDRIKVTDLHSGQALTQNNGRIIAIAHGKPSQSLEETPARLWPERPLPLRVERLDALDLISKLLPVLKEVVERSSDLEALRQTLNGISYGVPTPGLKSSTLISLQEAASHTLRLTSGATPKERPTWQGQGDRSDDWIDFKKACRQHAGGTDQLGLIYLQCVLDAV